MDILSKAKGDGLKRAGVFGWRNCSAPNRGCVAKCRRFIKTYFLTAAMSMMPVSCWQAVAKDKCPAEEISPLRPDTASVPVQTGDTAKTPSFVSLFPPSVKIVDDFEQCLKTYGNDLAIDVSRMEFSKADLALAKGLESAEAKQLWKTAVSTYTGPGRCTRCLKRSFVKLGWTRKMSSEDFRAFDRVVPAWGLIKFLDEGKIGNLVKFNLKEDERKSKTMPITGVVRVNEPGETVNAHVQVMGPAGSAFGEAGGISNSPEGHRAGGRLQRYGTAHFYLDRATLVTVVQEMQKIRSTDMVFVLDTRYRQLKVFPAENVPEQYLPLIERTRRFQQIGRNLRQQRMPADALALKKIMLPTDGFRFKPTMVRNLDKRSR